MIKKIQSLIESKIGQLFFGFALTTALGSILNVQYQEASWKREQKFEILKRSLTEYEQTVEGISELISQRAFKLDRVIWVLPQKNTGITNTEIIKTRWDDYYSEVMNWQKKIKVDYSKLYFTAGKDIADLLYIGEERSGKEPSSIYEYFSSTHDVIFNACCCINKQVSPACHKVNEEECGSIDLDDINKKRNELNTAIYSFLIKLYSAHSDIINNESSHIK